MAAPRGRGGGRGRGASRGAGRGGGYSDRGPASRSRAGSSRSGSYRDSGGGPGPGPMLAVVIGGGVIAIILIVILATQGGESHPVHAATAPASPPPATTKKAGKPPPKPLTDTEQERIRKEILDIAKDEPRAQKLIDEGFRLHQTQDYAAAQAKWHEANRLITDMQQRANALFEQYGGLDGSERVETYMPSTFEIFGKWNELKARIIKVLK